MADNPKKHRILKISLALVALLLLALWIAPNFIRANDFKPMIVQQFKQQTGLDLSIGSIKASFFPWLGVRVKDIHVHNPEGFSQDDLLSLKHIDVRVALLPLLHGELKIKQFLLIDPVLSLQRNRQGQLNYATPLAEAGTASAAVVEVPQGELPETTSLQSLGVVFSAKLIHLSGGRIEWRDAVKQNFLVVHDVDMRIDDVLLSQPIVAHLSATYQHQAIQLEGQFGPFEDLASIDLSRLPMQWRLQTKALPLAELAKLVQQAHLASALLDVDVLFEQHASGERVSAGSLSLHDKHDVLLDWQLQLDHDADLLRLPFMQVSLDGQKVLKAYGEFSSLQHSPHYRLSVQSETFKRQDLQRWFPDLKAMYAAHSQPWQQLSLGFSVSGNAEEARFPDVKLHLDDDWLHARASVQWMGEASLRLSLTASQLHLDPWLPAKQQKHAQSSLWAVQQAFADTVGREPDLRFLRDWKLHVQAQFEHVLYQGLSFDQCHFVLKGRQGHLLLQPARLDLAGGKLEATLHMNINDYPVRWRDELQLSNVRIEPLLQHLTGKAFVDGRLTAHVDVAARGLLIAHSLPTLQGKGDVQLSEGSVHGFDLLAALSGQSAAQSMTAFKQLSASFQIKEGVLSSDDLFAESTAFRLTGKAELDLPRQQLEAHLRPRLSAGIHLPGVSLRSGLMVPVYVHGPFDNVAVSVELSPAGLLDAVGTLLGSDSGF